MKRLYIFSILIIFALTGSSIPAFAGETGTRAVLLEESFEGTFPPSGWTLFSEGLRVETWQAATNKKHDGSQSAVGETQVMFPCNIWLVTPAINLSSAAGAKLYFYEDADAWDGNNGTNYVAVSTTSPGSASAFTNVAVMTPDDHTIAGFEGDAQVIDLSAYAGESVVYIGFHYSNPGNPNYSWYIDDVKVTMPSNHDVMVFSLNMENHYTPNTTITPQATISNEGLNAESFDVDFGYYNLDNNKIVLDSRTISNLASQTSQIIEFDNYTFGLEQFRFFVETKLANDDDPANDEMTRVINSFPNPNSVVLAEEFTGTWCQYCPGCAKSLDSLVHTYPDEIAIVAFHNGDDFANSHAEAREDFYGITGFPTTIFGGTRWSVGGANASADWSGIYASYEQLFFAEQAEYTPYNLDLSFVENGSIISATAISTFDAVPMSYNHDIYFALCESHIAYNWQTSMDSLHFVERDLFPDDNGEPVYTGTEPPAIGTENYNFAEFSIPAGVVKENCELIAFIQDPATKEIIVTAKVDLGNEPSAVGQNLSELPEHYGLSQNYPNPFNPTTTISYQIPESGEVHLALFNSAGEKIRTLVQTQQSAGKYEIHLDGSDLSSGIYFYQIRVNDYSKTSKMVLMK